MSRKINILFYTLMIGLLFALSNSCEKDDPKSTPALTTTIVNEITQTTAFTGGIITNDGGTSVTTRGVCWSTNQTPTINDSKTMNGAGTGSFTTNIANLTPNTTYYLRAYATNIVGTSYGNEVSFKTLKELETPTLLTADATDISQTTAASGGIINDDGGAPITIRGICWSTNQTPTIYDSKTMNGTGTGRFNSNIANLTPNTTYYIRAYATNIVGTSYGNDVSFKTLEEFKLPTLVTAVVSEITQTSAIAGGNITDDGGAPITIRGICWSKKEEPTINDSKTIDGTGKGSFISNIKDLTPNTTYFVRSYATNSVGTVYGNTVSFKTLKELGTPNLSTIDATEITPTTAVAGGNITDDGGATIISRGICWSKKEKPTINDSKTLNGVGPGSFTSNIANLAPNTTYYIRAYATNIVGTSYGNEVSFKTLEEFKLPTLVTAVVSEITQTSAIAGGNITDNGGAPVTARGICWSLNEKPTINDSKTIDGTGKGSFISNVKDLTPNTTYFVRAYATNSVGTIYGNTVSFKTLKELEAPILKTVEISEITQTTAVSGGNITSDGGAPIITRGICWSKNENPSINDNKTNDGFGKGSFSSNIIELTPNTKYYVRAYAINTVETSYGNSISFTTKQNDTNIEDIDGNIYPIVKIGTQTWMAENLKTTKYNDGVNIRLVTENNAWSALTTPAYCWYDNDDTVCKNVYGALYNWYTVNTGKLCPKGWHVPTDSEWTILTKYLGGDIVAGGKLKETGTVYWAIPNEGATNETNFTARPGGHREIDGEFLNIKFSSYWWSSTEQSQTNAWIRDIFYVETFITRYDSNKREGASVRCIRD